MKSVNSHISQPVAQVPSEKDALCISVIVAAHEPSSEKWLDAYAVQQQVSKAKEHLVEKMGGREAEAVVEALNVLSKEIRLGHNMEGVGLFVSNNVRKWAPLYFPVKDKIVVGDRFEDRELLFQDIYAEPYSLLLLSGKEARLYTGTFDQLEEINGIDFPVKFADDYEYSHPTRSLTYEGHAVTKEVEREKSQLQELRREKFLREVDDLLQNHAAISDPLIVAGSEKELSYFLKITKHANIAGSLHGNYFYLSREVLGDSTWKIIRSYWDKKKQKLLLRMENQQSTDAAEYGIQDCWQAAEAGRGDCLLVEQNFSCAGYLKEENPTFLHLTQPAKPFTALPDAVNSLIALVQEKGGQVVLVDDGQLEKFQHVSLLTRY